MTQKDGIPPKHEVLIAFTIMLRRIKLIPRPRTAVDICMAAADLINKDGSITIDAKKLARAKERLFQMRERNKRWGD
jgi:hypothetical protein